MSHETAGQARAARPEVGRSCKDWLGERNETRGGLDGDRPVLVINVEVQLVVDPKKRLSWPACVTISSLIHGCPANLLVVAPDPAVADWCAEPIEIGAPGFVLRPLVLRRAAVPAVTDILEAIRRPELGVLSVMAHGETELGAIVAAAVLPAIQSLANNRTKMSG